MDSQEMLRLSIGDEGPPAATLEGADQIYATLPDNHIRVMKILSGEKHDEICCITETLPIDQAQYTALSYAWGAPPASRPIKLNGIRCHIRTNLWRFLHQTRGASSGSATTFWIDALCINQADNRERMHQVSQMAQIFSQAQDVLAWLGPAYGDSDSAMSELNRPISYWENTKHFNAIWTKDSVHAIQRSCGRPYWKRLWIFQELILARWVTVQCGSRILPLERLRLFLIQVNLNPLKRRLQESVEYALIKKSAASAIVLQTLAPAGESSLWKMIFATAPLQCTEVRDRVYALLGVISIDYQHISPDYDMPVTNLLNLVMKAEHDRRRPQSIAEVERQCEQLTSLFGTDYDSLFAMNEYGEQFTPVPQQYDMHSIPLQYHETPFSLWWTSFYGHSAIEALMVRTDAIHTGLLYNAVDLGISSAVRLLLETGKMDAGYHSDSWTPLHLAAFNGQAEILDILLNSTKYHPNVNAQLTDGRTSLLLGIENHHHSIVKLLLRQENLDVDLACDNGDIALHAASEYGDETLVRLLLPHIPDINLKGRRGLAALHLAASGRNTHVLKLLCRRTDLKVNCAENERGMTALHIAAEAGSGDAIRTLLETGADVNRTTSELRTALHLAVVYQNVDALRPLLAHQAVRTNVKDFRKDTPLHLAARTGYDEVTQPLLNHKGIDVNAQNQSCDTALVIAVREGHEKIFQQILNHKDLEYRDQENKALEVAVELGREAIVERLLSRPPKRIWRPFDRSSEPLLHVAVRLGYDAIVDRLLNYVDVNDMNKNGMTALHVAAANGNEAIVNILLQGQVSINLRCPVDGATPLHMAVRANNRRVVRQLVEHQSTDVNSRNNGGETPAWIAISRNQVQIFEILLNSSKLNMTLGTIYQHWTFLHLAASRDRKEIVQMILREDIPSSLSGFDESGWTPLHLAAAAGHSEVVSELIASGRMDVNAPGGNGRTALDRAVNLHRTEVVRVFLRTEGIDIYKSPKNRSSPYEVALSMTGSEIKRMFDEFVELHALSNTNTSVIKRLLSTKKKKK